MEAQRQPPQEPQGPPPDQYPATGPGAGWYGAPISWINVAAGIWQFFSPWIWGYSRFRTPFVNDLILGALIFIAALVSATSRYRSASWWNVVFGIWLIISPFVLGYYRIGRATANDIIVGIIVVIVALAAAWSPGRTTTT